MDAAWIVFAICTEIICIGVILWLCNKYRLGYGVEGAGRSGFKFVHPKKANHASRRSLLLEIILFVILAVWLLIGLM